MGRTFFANSGAEAVDSAIKLAWYYHRCMGRRGRVKILSHQRGYHGTTVTGASATGLDLMHNGFGLPLPNFIKLPCPDPLEAPGQTPHGFTDRLITRLEEVIRAEGPDTIAAFIGEPILGAGGIVIPPPTTTTDCRKYSPVTTSCSSPTRSSPASAAQEACSPPTSSA
jgi:4-aminobutyrate--pyruvate transaminase